MPCSQETLALFFYTVSNLSLLFLLFFYFFSTLLLRFINIVGSYPIIPRSQNGYDYTLFTDEEEEEEEGGGGDDNETYFHVDNTNKEHVVADVIHSSESLLFFSNNNRRNTIESQETVVQREQGSEIENQGTDDFDSDKQYSVLASAGSDSGHDDEEDMQSRNVGLAHNDSPMNRACPASKMTLNGSGGLMNCDGKYRHSFGLENKSKMVESNFSQDENFFIFAPKKVESKKQPVEEKDDEEIFGDSCTVGSTSKSSSEWRSSIKDSGTEDPFSSSSRRSCPRWESYTVFEKYDEEMMFLDRISAQKLHDTESLRSIQVCPRSISDRIVHKFASISKNPSEIRHNPYHELESAYVAQICLTWEALNCNYINFQRKRANSQQQDNFDPGGPARVAQQFQQFQVLLQRYVENEPYEQGRRPEVYARMRLLAPKLLLVPEYREDDQKDEGFSSRISSAAFLLIMEEGIRTFMNFLKADKEKACTILADFFKRKRKRSSVDPAFLQLMKKVNKKKQTKLKELRRAGKCLRRRKLKVEEEMEILMGLIDLKLVSRVLRMADLNEQQLHWCEEKMSKVRILDGKLQRDSSPLFFPAH